MATIFHRIYNLRRLERRRVDTTLTRIHKTPWIMFLFNVFLLTMNAFVRLQESTKRTVVRVMGRVTESGAPGATVARARDVPHKMIFKRPRILLVVEESVQQCYTYRVAQKLEQLRMIGWDLSGGDLPAESNSFWRDHKSAKVNAIRTKTAIEKSDVAVIRFGDKYKQWNAAFDAGFCAAIGKPYITLHDDNNVHALKEVDAAALAWARNTDQVVDILRYITSQE